MVTNIYGDVLCGYCLDNSEDCTSQFKCTISIDGRHGIRNHTIDNSKALVMFLKNYKLNNEYDKGYAKSTTHTMIGDKKFRLKLHELVIWFNIGNDDFIKHKELELDIDHSDANTYNNTYANLFPMPMKVNRAKKVAIIPEGYHFNATKISDNEIYLKFGYRDNWLIVKYESKEEYYKALLMIKYINPRESYLKVIDNTCFTYCILDIQVDEPNEGCDGRYQYSSNIIDEKEMLKYWLEEAFEEEEIRKRLKLDE